jgi:hypothetical protein
VTDHHHHPAEHLVRGAPQPLELGVADRIFIRSRVPYRTALELQLQADVLLLLQWNDSQDEGAIPAKLFEYLYARRPILFYRL